MNQNYVDTKVWLLNELYSMHENGILDIFLEMDKMWVTLNDNKVNFKRMRNMSKRRKKKIYQKYVTEAQWKILYKFNPQLR